MRDRCQSISFAPGGLALAALGAAALLGASFATAPQQQNTNTQWDSVSTHHHAGICEHTHTPRQQQARAMIERQIFGGLSAEHQAIITAETGYLPSVAEEFSYGDHSAVAVDTDRFARVADVVDRATFARFKPVHREMLATYADRIASGEPVVAMCFAPGTDPDLVFAFNELLERSLDRFQQTNRWSSTATDGGGLGQGDPTTLTYSFVPDGTFIPDIGVGTGNSNLFAMMRTIYGSGAGDASADPTWQAHYATVFGRWGELCGATYVLELNDDGSQLNTASGSLGVRGDLRMAAMPIDGNSGILAYNNFPQDGDMVLDGTDNFYDTTTGNSLRLINVLAHEHGHGMGQLHVCPIQETKLMEPFFSDNFAGPQHDDIQNASRHYGDPLEHNDTSGTATDLGILSNSGIGYTNLSIDDNSDVDYFEFTLSGPSDLTATVIPIGLTYTQGPQTQQCNGGSSYNSLTIHDLSIEVLDTDGSTVLLTADSNGLGGSETAAIPLAAGTYFVRVNGGATNTVQLYDIDVDAADVAFLPITISLPGGSPATLVPGDSTDFDVQINEPEDTLVPATALLAHRYDGGSYIFTPLVSQGGNLWTATLPPALCEDSPEFYISAEGVETGVITEPAGGAATPLVAIVSSGTIQIFSDDFESDQGWTVTGGATDGQWERGDPVDNGRGDPSTDSDGSGQCLLTDNQLDNGDNSDVDGGTTTITSPLFDMSGGGTIAYDYWVDDGPGVFDADELRVEVATNAGSTNWQTVRTYATASPAWQPDSVDASEFGGGTSTVRIRFSASDLGAASLIECGVDAVVVSSSSCTNPPVGCDGDANSDNIVDVNDISYVLFRLGNSGPPGTVDGDANGDGIVDVNDISYVLFRLGPC
jgi:hypothetical protein